MISLSQVWNRWSHWWHEQFTAEQWRVLGVGVATLIGASYRLFHLRETMQFWADQGRDAIIAFEILHGNITLVGPSTSVGSMYLGPLYYYFMAPFLWLTGYDPIGPTLAVVALGILTVPLLYWVGKRLVGPWPAFFATLLYATAPAVLTYTRFSWNPNPAPIVTLGILYAIWKAWHGSARWWIVATIGFLVMIQLHYVALLLVAPLGLFWLADILRSWRGAQKTRTRQLLLFIPLAGVLLLLSYVPLMLFNWRFDNVIVKGFIDFFDGSPGESPRNTWDIVSALGTRAQLIFFELWGKSWGDRFDELNKVLLALYAAVAVIGWRFVSRTKYRFGYLLLLVTALTSILGLAYYRGAVFYHYVSYFFPVSYLLTGVVLTVLVRQLKWIGVGAAASLLIYISWLHVQTPQLDYIKQPGWTMDDMKKTADRILERIPADKSYSMTTLSEVLDYRGLNYRYFLLKSSHPPVPLENFGGADLLVIIAENPTEEEKVLGSPVYEVVTFPKGEYVVYPPDGIGPHIYVVERRETEIQEK